MHAYVPVLKRTTFTISLLGPFVVLFFLYGNVCDDNFVASLPYPIRNATQYEDEPSFCDNSVTSCANRNQDAIAHSNAPAPSATSVPSFSIPTPPLSRTNANVLRSPTFLYRAPEFSDDVRARSHGVARFSTEIGTLTVELFGPSICIPGVPVTFRLETKVASSSSYIEPEYNVRVVGPKNSVFSSVLLKSIFRDDDSLGGKIIHLYEVSCEAVGNHTLIVYTWFPDVADTLEIDLDLDNKETVAAIRRMRDHFIGNISLSVVFSAIDVTKPCDNFIENELRGTWHRVGWDRDGHGSDYTYSPATCTLPTTPMSLPLLKRLSKNTATVFLGDSLMRTNFIAMLEHMLGFSPAFPYRGIFAPVCKSHLSQPRHKQAKSYLKEMRQWPGLTWQVPISNQFLPLGDKACHVAKGQSSCLHQKYHNSFLSLTLRSGGEDICRDGWLNATIRHFKDGKVSGAMVLTYVCTSISSHALNDSLNAVTAARQRPYDLVVYNVGLHDTSHISLSSYKTHILKRATELSQCGVPVLAVTSWSQNPRLKRSFGGSWTGFKGVWTFSASAKRSRAFNDSFKAAMQGWANIRVMDLMHMTSPLIDTESNDGVHFHPAVTKW
eukprot:CAMPEP_0184374032 /NCGR_PEP_ID=MMETSP1089-20130417/164811_1 /TAXON_ID=38269 ORGANISM="Gloeochaete wittrockiana, Strain SAG46.84" /NCGR_SAMPLE_ID=MMETSP1089 /ASSEMBLY_ACC=CAM_ASM_000445 /LENGTH=607 /DNA_ID=CAMNT_0026717017 /DNA_START=109 /DNA_END=1929 /DNA_ORIENTATION=-